MTPAGVAPTPQALGLTLTTAFWMEPHMWRAGELDQLQRWRESGQRPALSPPLRLQACGAVGHVLIMVCTDVCRRDHPQRGHLVAFLHSSSPITHAFWLSFPLERSSSCTIAHL